MLWICLWASGCVTHLAPNPFSAQRIETLTWVEPLDEASATGRALDRPVLLVLAAGDREGFC